MTNKQALTRGMVALLHAFDATDEIEEIRIIDDRGGTGTWLIHMLCVSERTGKQYKIRRSYRVNYNGRTSEVSTREESDVADWEAI